MISACRVELCDPSADQEQKDYIKTDIVTQLIEECKGILSPTDPIICEWHNTPGLLSPQCNENQIYDPCARKCEILECGEVKTCGDEDVYEALCVCQHSHMLMIDGKCAETCPPEALFENWMHWSECSRSCGTGSRQSSRLCQGPGPCVGEATRIEDCETQHCGKIKLRRSVRMKCRLRI